MGEVLNQLGYLERVDTSRRDVILMEDVGGRVEGLGRVIEKVKGQG